MGGKVSSIFKGTAKTEVQPDSSTVDDMPTDGSIVPAPTDGSIVPAPADTSKPKPKQEKDLRSDEDSPTNQLLHSGITIDTYWKNAPPKNCEVFWVYSSSKGGDYYFMSADTSNYLERKYQKGRDISKVPNKSFYSEGQTIDFDTGKQVSRFSNIKRNVRRITAKHYQELMQQYQDVFNKREVLWCLSCRKSYVLYAPGYQQELDAAYSAGNLLMVSTNDCYTYTIDPRNYTQKNNKTGRVREIARVYREHNSKPIYGAYHLKIDVSAGTSIMDRSCIYNDE